MLHFVFAFVFLVLPHNVESNCCRLPFTTEQCQVRREGPHRYQIMPDRRSGRVLESTECYINDFDANYRQVIETKNYCNDCPGLLILQTNSSDIFLFPEYLERILEGRTEIQRKNVVILTTSLVGAYDLDFTYLARYYASRPINEVPSIYVDLQLPAFDSRQEIQPSLRLRLPTYNDDKQGSSKINRNELINPANVNTQISRNFHQLPYLYHFDIEIHRHSPDFCTLYDVEVSSSSLSWKTLDSGLSTCHTFMPYLGRNRCLASGFTRLFCPIEENIFNEDRLQLSPYLRTTNHVEHVTIAVIGGRQVQIVFSNDQIRPAKQVKILLLQGYLTVTDVNQNLPIRVEYGWNCADFGVIVPAGFSATRYRRFDKDNLNIHEGSNLIDLPPCFRVIPNPSSSDSTIASNVILSPSVNKKIDKSQISDVNRTKSEIVVDLHISEVKKEELTIDLNTTNSTIENYPNVPFNIRNIFHNENNLTYAILTLLVLVALVPLCLGIFYIVYSNEDRKSNWTVGHDAKKDLKTHPTETSIPSYVHHSTQTTDTPIRI